MPAAVPIASLALSAGTSAYQIISAESAKNKASKDAEEAKKAAESYQRQNLVNPNERIQVSTLGTDRMREDLARATATYANLAAMGGSRAVAGIAPQMIAQQNQQGAQIAANLDEQEARRQYALAQGDAMVQGMMEQRERDDLLGIGNQYNVAMQNQQAATNQQAAGIQGLAQTGITGAYAYNNGLLGRGINPQGTNPFIANGVMGLPIYPFTVKTQ